MPTAEDVIITKLHWAERRRGERDRDDVRDVIAVQGNALDWPYIENWCDQQGTREALDKIRESLRNL